MKTKEELNEEINVILQSLEEAIVLVNKEQIVYQNSEFESIIQHFDLQKKQQCLDNKLFQIVEEHSSETGEDSLSNF